MIFTRITYEDKTIDHLEDYQSGLSAERKWIKDAEARVREYNQITGVRNFARDKLFSASYHIQDPRAYTAHKAKYRDYPRYTFSPASQQTDVNTTLSLASLRVK